MSDTLYDLYFHGELVPGAAAALVKKNLATVFKSDEARIEALFNGQSHCIKKNLDQAAADKYTAILRKAGAVLEARAQGAAAPAAASPAAGKGSLAERLAQMEAQGAAMPARPSAAMPTAAGTDATAGLTISAPGAVLVRPEEHRQMAGEPAAVTVPDIATETGYARLSPEAPPPPPAPDTSALSVADSYERLSPQAPPPPPPPDTEFLSLADAGGELLQPGERKAAPAVTVPDTSHLAIKP